MSHRDSRRRRRDRDPAAKRFDSRRVIKSSSYRGAHCRRYAR